MRVIVTFGLLLAVLSTARAAEPVLQKLSDAGCATISTDEVGAASLCHGPDGTPFILADFDARISVTFGGVDSGSKPAYQSFTAFNSVGETIEWRMEAGQAVAAILRWTVENGEGGEAGSVLVVSRVGSGDSPGCVAAYVDARANPQANVLAREASERIVPNIDCATHVPFYFGERRPTAGEPTLPARE